MNNDQVSSVLWFFLGLLICLGSVKYKLGSFAAPGSGFMPFLTGVVICILSGIGFIQGTIRRRGGEGWDRVLEGVRWKNAGILLCSLCGYAFFLIPLGFLLCTAFFISFLLRAIVPQRWPVVIGGGILTAIASYLVFEVWLRAQLPKGFLGI